ncbi:MAG: di-trans,poly-cis-decaprenylcistransferase [Bacteroidetes bacterium GWE2_29_8]|nr:MAG: di-trans,poly-cis-decaprenylcistransferase [Bacteroidetes bacterium GWE2_29_8]OFY18348.1 MAG: di-trans,poly-cis-decaprenylcistransferase [Bacteroidetes bacterium GWF2_29_10]
MSFLELLTDNIPQHVAIIMDGNGRWANQQGKERVYGHKHGANSVKEVVEGCGKLGVKYLTLYAFSTENWNRPQEEVNSLMELLVESINAEADSLMTNKIRLHTIGDINRLPQLCSNGIEKVKELTLNNDKLNLILALSYSSKWEIINAVKKIAMEVKENKLDIDSINSTMFGDYLSTANIPDPEILIRTSGEYRMSNFLLWQLAYSELYFTDKLWPDFKKEDLYEAIHDYQKRERRYGKTSEQINQEIKK